MESSRPALLDRGYKAHRQGGSKPGQGVISRRSWTWSPAASGPAAQHAGHNIRQEAMSVLLSDTEHLHVMPVPDLLHEGQWLPFGNWDGAKDNGAWCGQRLADRLNERLAEQLHLPNLINDAHTVPGAAAGTGVS